MKLTQSVGILNINIADWNFKKACVTCQLIQDFFLNSGRQCHFTFGSFMIIIVLTYNFWRKQCKSIQLKFGLKWQWFCLFMFHNLRTTMSSSTTHPPLLTTDPLTKRKCYIQLRAVLCLFTGSTTVFGEKPEHCSMTTLASTHCVSPLLFMSSLLPPISKILCHRWLRTQ